MIKRMYRGAALASALSAFVASTTAFAAESAEGGLPQLDTSTFSSQLFWLVVTFAIFYVILSTKALPKVTEVLEQRANQISGDIEKAQQLQAEASQVVAEYEKSLITAREAAKDLIAKASEEVAADRTEKERLLAKKLSKQALTAQDKIEAARAQALTEIHSVAAELAVEISEKVSHIAISSDDAKAYLDKRV